MPYNGETELGTAAVDDLLTAGHINDIRARIGGTPPVPSGGYTPGIFNRELAVTGNEYTPTADFLIVVPIRLDKSISVTHICVFTSTPHAGKVIRTGLYGAGSDGLPDGEALIEEAAEGSAETPEAQEMALSGSRTLGPGLMYLALITDSATATFNVATRESSLPIQYLKYTGSGQKGWFPIMVGYASRAYGALPDPCPAMTYDERATWPIHFLLKEG